MNQLMEESIYCPYCGESIDVLIDTSEMGQEYIEDCQVCCRPIVFHLVQHNIDEYQIMVNHEDEV